MNDERSFLSWRMMILRTSSFFVKQEMGTSFKTSLGIDISKISVFVFHLHVPTLFHLTNSQHIDRVMFYGDNARKKNLMWNFYPFCYETYCEHAWTP